MSGTESATARLSRLLTMVPWLVNRQGVDIDEAAQELGVSRQQIEADLNLLFVCGTPGHLPDDLIDAQWETDRVFLTNADTIARPLRLDRDEALALIVGLRTLQALPGLGERDAVERALAKLVDAAGDSGAEQVQVDLDDATASAALAQLRGAVERHRRVHLRYLVAARDEATERDVDPMRVVSVDGTWYLEGWCHRAQDQRLFRLDRIERLEVLDVDGTPPADARPRDLDGALFRPSAQAMLVRLELEPDAAWVADYYPVESLGVDAHGCTTVELRVDDPAWVVALVWRLGGMARVIEPIEVRERVLAGAGEARAAYGGSDVD